jgi:GNAT superfamily N-acetyltransferase
MMTPRARTSDPAASGPAASGPAASGPGFRVIRAGEADVDVLSQVIADAFFDLAPSRWLIPDLAARREVFPGYFRLYVEHAVTAGVVHTTPDRDAAALWIPAGDDAAARPAEYAARLAAATSPWTGQFLAFDAALDQRHPAGIPHRHLAILAVRPDRQGRGAGTALLRACHHWLDRDVHAPAYLEASGLRTRQMYLRHGYADHGPPIHLPGGPAMYPMWREALLARTRTAGDASTSRLPPDEPAALRDELSR